MLNKPALLWLAINLLILMSVMYDSEVIMYGEIGYQLNVKRINPALVFFDNCKDEIAKSNSLSLEKILFIRTEIYHDF